MAGFDALQLAAAALLAARLAGLLAFMAMAGGPGGRRHVPLLLGWGVYTASPVAALTLGATNPWFPALAAAGTIGVAIAALSAFDLLTTGRAAGLIGLTLTVSGAVAIAAPGALGALTVATQAAAVLSLAVAAVAFGSRLRARTPRGYRMLVLLALLHGAFLFALLLARQPPNALSLVGTVGLNVLAIAFFLRLEEDFALAAMRRAEGLAGAIIESVPQRLFFKDLDGAYGIANQLFARDLGVTPDSLVGKKYPALALRGLASSLEDFDARDCGAEGTLRYDVTVTEADEHQVVQVTKSRVRADGEVIGFVGMYEDVTYDRMAEGLLRESESRFRTTFETAGAGISHVSLDGTVLRANRKLAAMLGYEVSELVGGPVSKYVHPRHAREDLGLTGRLLSGELRDFSGERLFIRKDGSSLWVLLCVALARDVAGAPAYFVRVTEDVTELKAARDDLARSKDLLEVRVERRTRELQDAVEEAQSLSEELAATNEELTSANENLTVANQELEEATRVKSAFMASVSHELRTPLNSIIGFSKILLDGLAGPLNDEQSKQMSMVQNAAVRQLELVDTLLDLEKIEAGALRPEPVEFDLAETVREVGDLLAGQAADKGLTLTVETGAGPRMVCTDRRFVWEIVLNLAANAVKYTDAGRVDIALPSPSVPGWFAVRVRDTGCGLDSDEIARIFDPFFQAGEGGRRRLRDSIGLGLAIASGLAEVIGGRIEVRSEPKAGATFTLFAPAECPSAD